MFRKYSCGCIGFEIESSDSTCFTLYRFQDCRGDDIDIRLHNALATKDSRELTPDELKNLIEQLTQLVDDGQALRALRQAIACAKL